MKIGLIIILVGIGSFTFGQKGKTKVPIYFGVQVKPILPTNFIGEPTTTQETQQGFKTVMTQKTGYSFGGIVRVELTKFIAMETGINLNQRKFGLDMAYPDSNAYGTNKLRFVTYDIPVKALIYIRLSDKFYMNTAVGANLIYNPTNVKILTDAEGLDGFRHDGLARKVNGEFVGSIGFELRTEKSGIFYLGGSATVPFAPIFYLRSQYLYGGGKDIVVDILTQQKGVDGSYFGIEFKYFLPIIKSKGSPFIPGPIEQ